jgi:hypothetical protein
MQMIDILRLFQENFSSCQKHQFILIITISECKNVHNEIIFNKTIINASLFSFIFHKKIKICCDGSSIKPISLK